MTTYTLGHHESVRRSHRWRTVDNSAAYLVPHLPVGAAVLDVGCGPGSITELLAELVGPSGSVLGIDSAPEVIDAATREHNPSWRANLRYEMRDVMNLDLDDGTFDVVHAHQVLQHLTARDRQWWGGLQADRITHSAIAEQVLASTTCTPEDLTRIAQAWRDWAATDTAWFAVLHGEVLCRVGGERG